MLRRNFLQTFSALPFLGFLAPKTEAKTELKTRIFITYGEMVTIVTNDESLLKKHGICAYGICAIVSHDAYRAVSDFISKDEEFNYLLNNGRPGIILYWEDNHSEAYRKRISELYPKISVTHLSNALYLFENSKETKEIL